MVKWIVPGKIGQQWSDSRKPGRYGLHLMIFHTHDLLYSWNMDGLQYDRIFMEGCSKNDTHERASVSRGYKIHGFLPYHSSEFCNCPLPGMVQRQIQSQLPQPLLRELTFARTSTSALTRSWHGFLAGHLLKGQCTSPITSCGNYSGCPAGRRVKLIEADTYPNCHSRSPAK